jgi:hypothetical protein
MKYSMGGTLLSGAAGKGNGSSKNDAERKDLATPQMPIAPSLSAAMWRHGRGTV